MQELNRLATVAAVVMGGMVWTGDVLYCDVELPALTNMFQPENQGLLLKSCLCIILLSLHLFFRKYEVWIRKIFNKT